MYPPTSIKIELGVGDRIFADAVMFAGISKPKGCSSVTCGCVTVFFGLVLAVRSVVEPLAEVGAMTTLGGWLSTLACGRDFGSGIVLV